MGYTSLLESGTTKLALSYILLTQIRSLTSVIHLNLYQTQ